MPNSKNIDWIYDLIATYNDIGLDKQKILV